MYINLTGTHYNARVGGLLGQSNGCSITECATNVFISSASSDGYTAGLVGLGTSATTIKRCTTTGTVTSSSSVATAGLVGQLAASTASVEDCYSTANITGSKRTAGLVAYNSGKVNRCYASGNVSSVYYGAGVVCENMGAYATTTNCVALNTKIEVSDQTGWSVRVVGNFANNAPEPSKDNLLAWKDMLLSVNGVPKTVYDNNLEGTSITTAETKNRDTYEALSWDFNEVWTMATDGYLQLKWLTTTTEPTVTTGDLNGDDVVNVMDIMEIIDLMVAGSYHADADLNGDSVVDMMDIVEIIDLMIAQAGKQGARAAMARTAVGTEDGDHITAAISGTELNIGLENVKKYSAFQMTVIVPDGMTLSDISLNTSRSNSHSVNIQQTGRNQYLVIGYSMDNRALKGNTGELITIGYEGTAAGEILIGDVLFGTTAHERCWLHDAAVVGAVTGISVTEEMRNGHSGVFYDLQGRRVNPQQKKGLYISEGKKINVK